MKWNSPASAVTIRNDAISSQENCHPGRKLENETYSDARVLSLLELFIVSSLPPDWKIPDWCTDTFIRQIIGEAIPPLLVYKIVKGIGV
jgi:DNA (cytosine-5)-methyltransferase 1